jgi:hypothetical protein
MKRPGRTRQFDALEIHAAEELTGDGVTDNADALDDLIRDAVRLKRQLIFSAPEPDEVSEFVGYFSSRSVSLPNDWKQFQMIGRGSGVCERFDQSRAGVRLIFDGTDGIRIPLGSNKHDQLRVEGLAIHNKGALGAIPTGIYVDIDEARTFSYPNMWSFRGLSFAGWTNATALVRRPATKNIDPHGFLGRMLFTDIHTDRCENSMYGEGVFTNLMQWFNCRLHNGGGTYWVNCGGFPKFDNCHWEAAPRGVLRFGAYTEEFEATFHNCETESCGTNIATTPEGLLHIDSWVQFDPGAQTRDISIIWTGHTRVPGAGEAPPRFDTRVRISNYSDNKVTVDGRGVHVLTPATIDIQQGTVDDETRWYTEPVDATGGAGTARTSVVQPLGGHRLFDQPAVPARPSGAWPYIECEGGTVFSGQNIRRTPDCIAEKQALVLSYVTTMERNVSLPANPGEIKISGTTKYWYPATYHSQSKQCRVVIMIRCDQAGPDARTLDGLAIAPYGTSGKLSLGYASWHPITEQVKEGVKQASALSCLAIGHPAGYSMPYLATVPAGGSHTVTVRNSPDKPISMIMDARVDTLRGARFIASFTGTTGAAATKEQAVVHSAVPAGSGVSFVIQDGADADSGQLVVSNSNGTACLLHVDIKL